MVARLNYLELPSGDVTRARKFYEGAFGWKFMEFAPTYAATTTNDTDVGLDGDSSQNTAAPLPVIEVAGLDAVRDRVKVEGGTISKEIFDFPGGRRFHFTDPDGHELGVWERAKT